jgi:hypothetical protein
MSDTASQSLPQLDNGEVRHTLSVHDVGASLVSAGVPRSHRQIIRYCETGMLDAVKVPGPTGAQWFVSPSSVPKAIGDLKQWEAQRAGRSSPKQDVSDHVVVEKERNNNSDTASHGAPEPAMSDKQTSQTGSQTEPAVARHTTSELDVYEHPYVKKLEDRVEKLESKYEAQVRRTEEIQLKSQQQLIELQRMTAIGQSQTLADFMFKAKEFFLGQGTATDKNEPPATTAGV